MQGVHLGCEYSPDKLGLDEDGYPIRVGVFPDFDPVHREANGQAVTPPKTDSKAFAK